MRSRIVPVGILLVAIMSGCQSSPSSGRRNHEAGCLVGSISGAVVGGLIGSVIGGGRGRTLATAAGVGLGTVAGNRLSCN